MQTIQNSGDLTKMHPYCICCAELDNKCTLHKNDKICSLCNKKTGLLVLPRSLWLQRILNWHIRGWL